MLNFKERRSFFAVLVYPALLVMYFMLHEYNDNYGLIPTGYTIKKIIQYVGIALIISLLSWFLFKSAGKALLFTLLFLCILLFFGAFHDAIKKWPVPVFFTRYTFILGFLLFMLIAVMVFFKRTHRTFIRTSRYIGIILIILCIWETATWGFNLIFHKEHNHILFSENDRDTSLLKNAGTTRPNIYFIVFDAFTSSKCLQSAFGYDNTSLDSILRQQGFYLVENSKSNYQLTPFSIASTLNFSYLGPQLNNQQVTAKDLIKGEVSLAHNRLVPFLERMGYTICNNSVFDLPGHPTTEPRYFDFMEKGLLHDQTLLGRVRKDILWNITTHVKKSNRDKAIKEGRAAYLQNFVTRKLNVLQQSAENNIASPKFVYGHFMLPHEPFYFNRDGSLVEPGIRRTVKQQYLEQLIYTNSIVRSVITTIFEKDKGNKIIILEGDHGFRYFDGPDKIPRSFDNLNAIYFYDQNYRALYDSISPVNTFRVVLNQYFGQQIPYLKDTSIYAREVSTK